MPDVLEKFKEDGTIMVGSSAPEFRKHVVNEIVRWGMTPADMPELAALIARGLIGNDAPESVAADVTAFRQRFSQLHYMR